MCDIELPVHLHTMHWVQWQRRLGSDDLLLRVRRGLPVRLGFRADLPSVARAGPHARRTRAHHSPRYQVTNHRAGKLNVLPLAPYILRT